jgi:hypothetical protein
MKLKNKIYTLLSVFTLVGLTHSLTLKELNAALTAPASFDFKYVYSSFHTQFMFTKTSFSAEPVSYVRIAAGAYYNYTSTIDADNTLLPEGLEITMTFNRSNTTWTNPFGSIYRPSDTKIGSNNTVGSVANKVYLTFDNQTTKNYSLFLDTSSTNIYKYNTIEYNDIPYFTFVDDSVYTTPTQLLKLFLPSYTKLEFGTQNYSSEMYLDAWYLQDLGVSNSYNNGYDNGQADGYSDGYSDGLNNNPNILLNGFQAMVGILVNFVLMIVNLEVFGVSIIGIFSIVVLFTGIVWVLKLIRG